MPPASFRSRSSRTVFDLQLCNYITDLCEEFSQHEEVAEDLLEDIERFRETVIDIAREGTDLSKEQQRAVDALTETIEQCGIKAGSFQKDAWIDQLDRPAACREKFKKIENALLLAFNSIKLGSDSHFFPTRERVPFPFENARSFWEASMQRDAVPAHFFAEELLRVFGPSGVDRHCVQNILRVMGKTKEADMVMRSEFLDLFDCALEDMLHIYKHIRLPASKLSKEGAGLWLRFCVHMACCFGTAERTDPEPDTLSESHYGVVLVDEHGRFGATARSLREAVEIAQAGDTVYLRPGRYIDTVDINKSITVIGLGDPSQVIVLSSGPTAIRVTATQRVVLSKLTIRHMGGGGEGSAAGPDAAVYAAPNSVLRIDDCDVTSETGTCVHVAAGAAAKICNSALHDGEHGVVVETAEECVVQGNEVSRSRSANVMLSGLARAVVQHNAIHDGALTGVTVRENGCGMISENRIFNNPIGIALEDSSEALVRGNVISKCDEYGVAAGDAARGRVTNNWIQAPGAIGIVVKDQASTAIVSNRIDDQDRFGIAVLDSAWSEVSGNRIRGCRSGAIDVAPTAQPRVGSNDVVGSMWSSRSSSTGSGAPDSMSRSGTAQENVFAGDITHDDSDEDNRVLRSGKSLVQGISSTLGSLNPLSSSKSKRQPAVDEFAEFDHVSEAGSDESSTTKAKRGLGAKKAAGKAIAFVKRTIGGRGAPLGRIDEKAETVDSDLPTPHPAWADADQLPDPTGLPPGVSPLAKSGKKKSAAKMIVSRVAGVGKKLKRVGSKLLMK